MTTNATRTAVLVIALLSTVVVAHAMGRHYVAEALASTVDVVAVPEMTQGPYFEDESDYVASQDMIAAARAGYSSTITTDRISVTQAINLTLTFNIWNVTNNGTEVFPLVGADVFLWHCDAIGRYSAVPQSEQTAEGTVGQKWLRGKQTTPTSGTVTFRTILAGWYEGRTIHYHVRVRLSGATTFLTTTQLFLNQTFITSYQKTYPYTQDTNGLTLLANDMHYNGVSAAVRPKLLLNASGSNGAGYGATYNLGIDVANAAFSTPAPVAGSGATTPPSVSATTTTPTTTRAPVAVSSAWRPMSAARACAIGCAATLALLSLCS